MLRFCWFMAFSIIEQHQTKSYYIAKTRTAAVRSSSSSSGSSVIKFGTILLLLEDEVAPASRTGGNRIEPTGLIISLHFYCIVQLCFGWVSLRVLLILLSRCAPGTGHLRATDRLGYETGKRHQKTCFRIAYPGQVYCDVVHLKCTLVGVFRSSQNLTILAATYYETVQQS